MNREVIENQVVRDLARHRSRNEIVKALCEETGMAWQAAQRLVEEVETNRQDEIDRRQLPLLALVGVATLVGGILLSAIIAVASLNGWMILFLRIPIPYLGNLLYFGIGLLIAMGGAMGLAKLRRKSSAR